MTGSTQTPPAGLYPRLSIMMFLQYAIWGAWLPLLWPFLNGHRGFSAGQIGNMFAVGAVAYLETEEDPARFRDITPVRLLDEITGRSALFLAWLDPEEIPVTIRWYFEFEMPRIHCDWGWRDFGMRRSL